MYNERMKESSKYWISFLTYVIYLYSTQIRKTEKHRIQKIYRFSLCSLSMVLSTKHKTEGAFELWIKGSTHNVVLSTARLLSTSKFIIQPQILFGLRNKIVSLPVLFYLFLIKQFKNLQLYHSKIGCLCSSKINRFHHNKL